MPDNYEPPRHIVDAYKRAVRARTAVDAGDGTDSQINQEWFDAVTALHNMKIPAGVGSIALDTALLEITDEDAAA